MRHSDIKVGCIYYVDFEPHRRCEFDGRHLSLVLRKNNDSNTLVVLPLTSSSSGLGFGKIQLGVLKCLPLNLQSQVTYAAVNSVRTVNCSRFYSVRDRGLMIAPKLDDDSFELALYSVMKDITYNTDEFIKVNTFRSLHIDASAEQVNNLLYKLSRVLESDKDKAKILKKEVLYIMGFVPYKVLSSRVDDTVKSLARRLYYRNFIKIALTFRF